MLFIVICGLAVEIHCEAGYGAHNIANVMLRFCELSLALFEVSVDGHNKAQAVNFLSAVRNFLLCLGDW